MSGRRLRLQVRPNTTRSPRESPKVPPAVEPKKEISVVESVAEEVQPKPEVSSLESARKCATPNETIKADTVSPVCSEQFEKSLSEPILEIPAPNDEVVQTTDVETQPTTTTPVTSLSSGTEVLQALLSSPVKLPKRPRIETSKPKRFYVKGKAPPERNKMTMLDLIYWNPSENPMPVPEKNSHPTLEENYEKQVEDDEQSLDEGGGGDSNLSLLTPKLKIGPNNEIIIDEESLVIHQKVPQDYSVLYEDSSTNYSSFRKKSSKMRWSKLETLMFYRALSVVGTDFSLMSQLLPKRSRGELKLKFKNEERKDRVFLNKILKHPDVFDVTEFAADMSALEKLIPNDPKGPKVKGEKRKRNPSNKSQGGVEQPSQNSEPASTRLEEIATNLKKHSSTKPRKKQKEKKNTDSQSMQSDDENGSPQDCGELDESLEPSCDSCSVSDSENIENIEILLNQMKKKNAKKPERRNEIRKKQVRKRASTKRRHCDVGEKESPRENPDILETSQIEQPVHHVVTIGSQSTEQRVPECTFTDDPNVTRDAFEIEQLAGVDPNTAEDSFKTEEDVTVVNLDCPIVVKMEQPSDLITIDYIDYSTMAIVDQPTVNSSVVRNSSEMQKELIIEENNLACESDVDCREVCKSGIKSSGRVKKTMKQRDNPKRKRSGGSLSDSDEVLAKTQTKKASPRTPKRNGYYKRKNPPPGLYEIQDDPINSNTIRTYSKMNPTSELMEDVVVSMEECTDNQKIILLSETGDVIPFEVVPKEQAIQNGIIESEIITPDL